LLERAWRVLALQQAQHLTEACMQGDSDASVTMSGEEEDDDDVSVIDEDEAGSAHLPSPPPRTTAGACAALLAVQRTVPANFWSNSQKHARNCGNAWEGSHKSARRPRHVLGRLRGFSGCGSVQRRS
jgi:hypothetical protein